MIMLYLFNKAKCLQQHCKTTIIAVWQSNGCTLRHLSLDQLKLVAGGLSRTCGKRVQVHTTKAVGHLFLYKNRY